MINKGLRWKYIGHFTNDAISNKLIQVLGYVSSEKFRFESIHRHHKQNAIRRLSADFSCVNTVYIYTECVECNRAQSNIRYTAPLHI